MMIMRREAGFTYLALLFFVAAMSAMLAVSGQLWSTAQQRVKEQDLLYIGGEFRQAIRSYYERTPGVLKRYPRNLEELLVDNRQAGTLRHLRRIYRDPMTLTVEWGIVRGPDGGIQGVYSLSSQRPMKSAGFSDGEQDFSGARSYRDWRFIYVP